MIPAHLQERNIDQLRCTQETIRCFMVQPTGEGFEGIVVTEKGQCVAGFDYHRSETKIRRFALDENGEYPKEWTYRDNLHMAVSYCTRCGNHDFSKEALANASGTMGRCWERLDTHERADNLNDFGPGAMYYATWYRDKESGLYWTGAIAAGKAVHQPNPPLYVRTPGGDWGIDNQASNCTLKDDPDHRCWPRVGEPPLVSVDKNAGKTCGAGGGSIVCGNYHGFLRSGFLVKC